MMGNTMKVCVSSKCPIYRAFELACIASKNVVDNTDTIIYQIVYIRIFSALPY